MPDLVRTHADPLTTHVTAVLRAVGAPAAAADVVAAHLVGAELCGVQTHGIYHIPRYLEEIERGELIADAKPRVVERSAGRLLVSGEVTFGHVAAELTVREAIAAAAESAATVAALVRVNHIGRLGHYAEMAAAEGLLSIICAGGFGVNGGRAAPFGGRERILDTNPLCIGFPAGAEPPVVVDFATTALSGVKVRNARDRGGTLPPGSIVDAEGRPTTDPQKFFDGGAFSPFGGAEAGHKGYALMLAVEMFGRLLTGSDVHAVPEAGVPLMRNQGVTFVLLRADLFQPLGDLQARADTLLGRIRTSRPAAGKERVLYPGLAEARLREERLREGIPIAADIWERFVAAGASVGVQIAR